MDTLEIEGLNGFTGEVSDDPDLMGLAALGEMDGGGLLANVGDDPFDPDAIALRIMTNRCKRAEMRATYFEQSYLQLKSPTADRQRVIDQAAATLARMGVKV
jgi:hypothetical protein